MKNVKAFIGAGGRAKWAYLVFQHNEHQVEEAERLASELGFKEFAIKSTSRYGEKQNPSRKTYNRKGEQDNILNAPIENRYKNEVVENPAKYSDLENLKSYQNATILRKSLLLLLETYIRAVGLILQSSLHKILIPKKF